MRISDWSSDVCSSDLKAPADHPLKKPLSYIIPIWFASGSPRTKEPNPCRRKSSRPSPPPSRPAPRPPQTPPSTLPSTPTPPPPHPPSIPEELRVGKQCLRPCCSRRPPYH